MRWRKRRRNGRKKSWKRRRNGRKKNGSPFVKRLFSSFPFLELVLN
ncbi:MAG: hypothetical protein JSW53_05405 [Candidatus Bathyarchaeota archaeon]|nr:MAG: hypothetical protein JSW53_05405 [Candidatus Bathyarchaeota archaeon]